MADGDSDDLDALRMEPTSTKNWTQREWALHFREQGTAIHALLVQLQTDAGIRGKVERIEEGPLFPHINHRPFNPKANEIEIVREREYQRHRLRHLYFDLDDETVRKRLIRFERAQDLAALRFHEAEHLAEHHEFAALEARVASWGPTAAIQVVVTTVFGALLGHAAGRFDAVSSFVDGGAMQIGAIAGAAVGIIAAMRLRDVTEHARRREVEQARVLLAESDRTYQSILDEPETFSEREERTGKPDEDFGNGALMVSDQ